jgi:hypothetical protein
MISLNDLYVVECRIAYDNNTSIPSEVYSSREEADEACLRMNSFTGIGGSRLVYFVATLADWLEEIKQNVRNESGFEGDW